MKSKKVLAALLSMTVVVSTALAGCGNSSSNTNAGAESASGKDSDQYINLTLASEPKTLDQSKATDLYASQILINTMEGLTRLETGDDGKDVVKPAGASEWKTSEDGLTWTFTLRDNKWSDGQPVTAKDYAYAVQRTLNPTTGSTYAFLLYPIKNAKAFNEGKAKEDELGVKVVDDKTIEFTLEKPCAYFLELTYFRVMLPLRQDIVEKNGDTYGAEANTLVYCGPYKIDEWVHNNEVALSKNDNYWDNAKVNLKKVTFKIIKEESARMNELQNGSLDIGAVSKTEWIDKFNATNQFDVKKGYDASSTYTFFNQNNKYFKNEKIRKAFILAEDRQGKVSTLFKGLAEVATAWCPPSVQIGGTEYREAAKYNALENLKKENPDPKALLIEGLKEEGLDPDPSKHTFTYLESGTSATNKEFAEFAQNNYQTVLGVKVNVDYVEWAIFQKRTDELDYELASMAWSGDYNDPNTFFDMWLSNAGIVPTGWKSADYDKLIEDASNTTDESQRLELFKKAEKLLLEDDAVISPGVWRFKNTYVKKFVKNYMSPTFGVVDLKYVYTQGRN